MERRMCPWVPSSMCLKTLMSSKDCVLEIPWVHFPKHRSNHFCLSSKTSVHTASAQISSPTSYQLWPVSTSFYLMHVNSLLQHGGARVISVTREPNQLGLCPETLEREGWERRKEQEREEGICRTLKDPPEASAAIIQQRLTEDCNQSAFWDQEGITVF